MFESRCECFLSLQVASAVNPTWLERPGMPTFMKLVMRHLERSYDRRANKLEDGAERETVILLMHRAASVSSIVWKFNVKGVMMFVIQRGCQQIF